MRKLTTLFSYLFVGLFVLSFNSCSSSESEPTSTVEVENLAPFDLIPSAVSGVNFNNEVIENEAYNHILQDVVFNGGGVGILDVNNDGFQDIFFAGNMVNDRLYLNTGKDLKFEDITEKAGLKKDDTWSTAVAIADVNNDGFQDIYVGKFMLADAAKRKNLLYINNGDLTFTESAATYGIADEGYCTTANFFDYDKDGDLDLYVGNQPNVSNHEKAMAKSAGNQAKLETSDRLFKFENGKFLDVTQAAGILNFNYTLSTVVSDLNNDGLPDIFVASDYEEPDFYYKNNGDGTFTNKIYEAFRHLSNFSMGADIADFNNDGFQDIYVTDMAAAENFRSKTNMSGMNPERFRQLEENGYHAQYMFNALHLNNANGTYSDIGQMAGVATSNWSWATLFGDFDNDGDKDLFVANGQPKDVKNKDYINRRTVIVDSLLSLVEDKDKLGLINSVDLVKDAPSQRLSNFMYENNDDLTFSDVSQDWGTGQPAWTQGAAFADFDNDGDLDLATNNMNDKAFIYKNNASAKNNFLQLNLIGNQGNNRLAYGAKAWIYTKSGFQVLELSPVRGYMSTSHATLNFGIGKDDHIEKLVVEWPDKKRTVLKEVTINQILTLKQSEAVASNQLFSPFPVKARMFSTAVQKEEFVHQENEYDDFKEEILLPHRMSRLGPCLAKSDVNNDGLEDVFVGGAAGISGSLLLQGANQQFSQSNQSIWKKDKASEDMAALFFDADGDGDDDLYVVSGGNEFKENDGRYQDRLYLNDGQGGFKKSTQLPKNNVSGGVVKAADFDKDGDLDLFVGGRQIPGKYGVAAPSFLLKNENGRFVDITKESTTGWTSLGMVSDAIWMDIDGDKDDDLIVAGEWMPITIFENNDGKFTKSENDRGLANTSGWWNRLEKVDIDNDGDLDIIAGNLGLNIKYKATVEQPFRAYVKDFDGNGTNDIYLGYYAKDGVCYPVRGRECSSQQLPFVKKEFKTYASFAGASIEEVLGERKTGAENLSAQLFESVYLENDGEGNFTIHKLPQEAQIAPIYGIVPFDWNKDGRLDLFVAGNYYEREVETVRSDAGVGQILLGKKEGGFTAMSTFETGIIASMDVRATLLLNANTLQPLLLIGNNNAAFQWYKLNEKQKQ